MDIGKIKWMVERAEGFEYREQDWIQTPGLYGYGFELRGDDWIDPVDWRAIYYPLLLQRAIEGINKDYWQNNKQLRIQQDHLGCQIFDRWGAMQTSYGLSKHPDNAKQLIIDYVYEQEKS